MDSHDRRQVEFYERTAGRYDRSVWSLGCRDNRNHETKIRAVAEAISADGGGRVLEVGAGTGLHGRWLLEHTPVEHTGLDLSEPMLRIAAGRLARFAGRSRLTIGDALDLPFPDAAFDAAFCVGTLHHLPSAEAGMRELARVVKPGGRVAALEPNWKFPSVLVYSAITPEERKTFAINDRRLVAWARRAGLTEVRLQRLLYTPPKPVRWHRTFDRIDQALARTPGLRQLSINLLVAGRRPA
ncbi:MAG TPA: methyltransferase domain-containing protein [Actinomycetota bacterium]|nr:methyltransferase domain-containing protein [Actinomycetota bacterium]